MRIRIAFLFALLLALFAGLDHGAALHMAGGGYPGPMPGH